MCVPKVWLTVAIWLTAVIFHCQLSLAAAHNSKTFEPWIDFSSRRDCIVPRKCTNNGRIAHPRVGW